jgi:hypothetical protein
VAGHVVDLDRWPVRPGDEPGCSPCAAAAARTGRRVDNCFAMTCRAALGTQGRLIPLGAIKNTTLVSNDTLWLQALRGAAAALDAKHRHTLHGPEGALLPGAEAESGGRRLLRSAAKPAFVVGTAIWLPLTMGCAPFERSAVSELRKLVLR